MIFTSNYLIYCPFSYEKIQDNWLLDIELYSEEFRADFISMQMEELNIECAYEKNAEAIQQISGE